jgi:hypothetical protein
MGPRICAQTLKQYFPLEVYHGNPTLQGLTLAVDVSILIYNIITSNKSVAEECDCNPKVYPIEFKKAFKVKMNWLLKNSDPVLVLDGSRNPLKSGENQARLNMKEKHRLELANAKMALDSDPKILTKLRKIGSSITEAMYAVIVEVANELKIKVYSAAMEADAQCVQLEMAGVVAGSITRDGDLFVHGSKLLVFMENWNSDGKCHIVKRSEGLEALGREYDLGRSFNDHEVRLWAVAQGCDFTKNILTQQQDVNWLFANEAYVLEQAQYRNALYYFECAPVFAAVQKAKDSGEPGRLQYCFSPSKRRD